MRTSQAWRSNNAAITPITEVASVRVQRKTRLIRPFEAGGLRQSRPMATLYRCVFRVPGCNAPTFLPRLRSTPITVFQHYYGGSDSCSMSERHSKWTFRLIQSHRSPCFTYSIFQTIPSPTTARSPVVAFPSATLFVSVTGFLSLFRLPILSPQVSRDRSGLRTDPSRLAETHGRNGFVNLRTGRSPPVALHPASRRRSYRRLQAVA